MSLSNCPKCGAAPGIICKTPSCARLPAPVTDGGTVDDWKAEVTRQAVEIERLRAAMQEAIDLLTERKHGNPARSPGHNARLMLEAVLPPRVL